MGYLFVIMASVLFGIYPSIQTDVLHAGVTPLALVVIGSAIAGGFSLTLALLRGESLRVRRADVPMLLLIGGIGLFLTTYLLNIAYTLIPTGFASMIHFLYPTVVCILMTALFREQMTIWKVAAMALSVVGFYLISGGGSVTVNRGIWFALMTAFTYAFYMIANDRSSVGEMAPMVRSFYLNAIVVVIALVAALLRGGEIYWAGPLPALKCLLFGVMFSAAVMLLYAGIGRLGAGTAAFINMLEPVTSLAVSAVAFRYAISCGHVVGCACIVCAMLCVIFSDRRRAVDTVRKGLLN